MKRSVSVVFDEQALTPILRYMARRLVENLLLVPDLVIDHLWVLEGRGGAAQDSGQRLWNSFDSWFAGLESGELKRGPAPTRVRRPGELPREPVSDWIFVFSAHPEALISSARSGRRGAFELRRGGVPIAASPDFGWSEVLNCQTLLSAHAHFIRNGSEPTEFGPWQVRSHATSPAGTAKALAEGSSLFLELAMAHAEAPRVPGSRPAASPSPGATPADPARLFAHFVSRKAQARVHSLLMREFQWGLGILPHSGDPVGMDRLAPETRWLKLASDCFQADPFLFQHENSDYLLFEELPFTTHRGHLCAGELDPAAPERFSARRILEKPFHLSFPFCFRHAGDIFLLPEQAESGRVQAYRAKRFPDQWEDGPVLLPDFPGVDSVLHEQEGLWWLFTSSARGGNHDNHLLLFYSESPFGPFTPHPLSPIRLGLEGSRMGGAIFRASGRLLRPGQNCARVYGGSLLFFEIEVLNTREYRERLVQETLPDAQSNFPDGFHSWSRSPSGIVAVDGLRWLHRFKRG